MHESLTRRAALQVGAWALGMAPRLGIAGADPTSAGQATVRRALEPGWRNPPRSCRPHTRWWWPGNAVTRNGIRDQLRGMRQQGLGGVELTSTWRIFEGGTLDQLSREHLEMVRHAVREAKRLDMEVSLTFGAGWCFGAPWVSPTDRSKCLAPAWVDLDGGTRFEGVLPAYEPPARRLIHHEVDPAFRSEAPDEGRLLAAVAIPLEGERVDLSAAVDLTDRVASGRIAWTAPPGRWRLAAFWLRYTGQRNSAQDFQDAHWVVDHLSPAALHRFADPLCEALERHLGDELGKTVDSLFCDSFEIVPLPNTILWSNALSAAFARDTGRALAPLLPALWWEAGPATAGVRYEVNALLHRRGMEVLGAFRERCERLGVAARVQPHYRFVTEIIAAAGVAHRPETEVTTARAEVVEDPRKAIVSGARFAGRAVVSAEAYTFLHRERYRATLQEMKVASDAFLRDGVTQLYNHGYLYSPDATVAPARDMPWGNPISPWSPWWRHYHLLAETIARSCHLLRQGLPVSDVLVYVPEAQRWSRTGVWNISRRFHNWGGLGNALVRAGYDFEVVNDELLQKATIERGEVTIGAVRARVLVLPGVWALPVGTMRAVAAHVRRGGGVVALGSLPSRTVGLRATPRDHAEVAQISRELFGVAGRPKDHPSGGWTAFLPDFEIPANNEPAPWAKPAVDIEGRPGGRDLMRLLQSKLDPDCRLHPHEAWTPSPGEGLLWSHRALPDGAHLYFVSNASSSDLRGELRLRAPGSRPSFWHPRTGEIDDARVYRNDDRGCLVPLVLGSWQSVFVVLERDRPGFRCERSELAQVTSVSASRVGGLAERGGRHQAVLADGQGARFTLEAEVAPPPAARAIAGPWLLTSPDVTQSLRELISWTDLPALRTFAGSARYETTFVLPSDLIAADLATCLDLGRVEQIAEVTINGQRLPTSWLPPHRLDVTGRLRRGENRLAVVVTNALANHVIGLGNPDPAPAASVRAHHRGRKASYVAGIQAFETVDRVTAPMPSGLMGPVRLTFARKVTLSVERAVCEPPRGLPRNL